MHCCHSISFHIQVVTIAQEGRNPPSPGDTAVAIGDTHVGPKASNQEVQLEGYGRDEEIKPQ